MIDSEVSTPEISRSAWRTLAVTSGVGFMVSLEITVIAFALPEIRQAFPTASESTLSWIITAYNIGVASLLLLSGWGADRFGRKKTFLTGLVIFALGSLASGFAVSSSMLILARIVQSVGGAMQFPAGLALLLPAFPIERRQMAIGIWGAMGGLAAALGPPIGGLLVAAFGWRSVFLINVPVAVLVIVFGRVWLEESRGEVQERVDVVSIPMASVGVGAIVLGIVQGNEWGWWSVSSLVTFAIGCALIALFIVRSRVHPAPLFDLDLFRLQSFRLGNIGTVLFICAFFSYFVPLPSFVQETWGWSATKAGVAIMPGPAVATVLSPLTGRLADRIGPGKILAVGGVAGVLSMVAHLMFTTEEPRFLLGLLLPGLLIGVAAGCSFAMAVAATMRDVPPQRFGMAGAGRTTVFQFSVALAIAGAVAVIGRVEDTPATLGGMRNGWFLALLLFAGQALLFGFFFPRGNAERP